MSRAMTFVQRKLDLPTPEFRRAFNSQWEYQEAGTSTAWDHEPQLDELKAALAECRSSPDAGFTHLLALAEAGSVVAMCSVGEDYYWGSGADADPVEAEVWLRRAYELGSRRGLLSYGRLVVHREDWTSAERIFRRGSAAGWPEAMYWVAWLIVKQAAPSRTIPAEALALLQTASDAGHPSAKVWLGWAMARGTLGVKLVPEGLRMLWAHLAVVRRAWATRDTPQARIIPSLEIH